MSHLIPASVRATIPPLRVQEHADDPTIYAILEARSVGWIWYVLEYDGADECFGLVCDWETEWGYFALSDLADLRDQWGVAVVTWRPILPMRLSQGRHLVEG
jgi:hypothetical protein